MKRQCLWWSPRMCRKKWICKQDYATACRAMQAPSMRIWRDASRACRPCAYQRPSIRHSIYSSKSNWANQNSTIQKKNWASNSETSATITGKSRRPSTTTSRRTTATSTRWINSITISSCPYWSANTLKAPSISRKFNTSVRRRSPGTRLRTTKSNWSTIARVKWPRSLSMARSSYVCHSRLSCFLKTWWAVYTLSTPNSNVLTLCRSCATWNRYVQIVPTIEHLFIYILFICTEGTCSARPRRNTTRCKQM